MTDTPMRPAEEIRGILETTVDLDLAAFDSETMVARLAALIERKRTATRDQIAAALMLACPCCEAAWNEPHDTDCTYAFDCPSENARRNNIIRALTLEATCPQP